MEVSDLLKIEGFTLHTPSTNLNKEISDIYISDLLSWVLGHVKIDNVLLITVINSINVIAISSLLNISAVVFCDGVTPSIDVIEKALLEDIPLLSVKCSSVDTLRKIDKYEGIL